VHDYFEIVGVARNARPTEVRRAGCRSRRATHPDVFEGDATLVSCVPQLFDGKASRELGDAAVDFIDASTLVEAIRASFFS